MGGGQISERLLLPPRGHGRGGQVGAWGLRAHDTGWATLQGMGGLEYRPCCWLVVNFRFLISKRTWGLNKKSPVGLETQGIKHRQAEELGAFTCPVEQITTFGGIAFFSKRPDG